MANAKGGWLILGVEDKTRRISGVPLEKLDSLGALHRRDLLGDSETATDD